MKAIRPPICWNNNYTKWCHFAILHVLLISGTSQAQNNCSVDEHCNSLEFCNIEEGYCEVCLDCKLYYRNFGDVQCVKNVFECGSCIEGYEEEYMTALSDTTLKQDFCVLTQPTVDNAHTTLTVVPLQDSSADDSTPTINLYNRPTSQLPEKENAVTDEDTPLTVKPLQNMPDDRPTSNITQYNRPTAKLLEKEYSGTTLTVPLVMPLQNTSDDVSFDDNATANSTLYTTEYLEEQYAKKNRPWIYIGIAYAFFLTCGTCGVVGFKYYILPKQQEKRRKYKEMVAQNNATKADIKQASPEEKKLLYQEPFASVDSSRYIGISPRITLKKTKPAVYYDLSD